MPEEEPVSLRDYVDTNFKLRDHALEIQQSADKQALALATSQLDARLEKLNELRGNVISKGEFDGLAKRVESLEKWQAKMIGIGIVLVLLSGFVGAMIMKTFAR